MKTENRTGTTEIGIAIEIEIEIEKI